MTTQVDETTRLRKELAEAERALEYQKQDRLRAEREVASIKKDRMTITYVFIGVVMLVLAVAFLLAALIWNSAEIGKAKARASVPTIHVTCQPGAMPTEAWVCSFQQEARQRGDLGGTEENE